MVRACPCTGLKSMQVDWSRWQWTGPWDLYAAVQLMILGMCAVWYVCVYHCCLTCILCFSSTWIRWDGGNVPSWVIRFAWYARWMDQQSNIHTRRWVSTCTIPLVVDPSWPCSTQEGGTSLLLCMVEDRNLQFIHSKGVELPMIPP